MPDHQFELPLPARRSVESLREELAAVVEALNAEPDPAERVRLHADLSRLRALLGIGEGQ